MLKKIILFTAFTVILFSCKSGKSAFKYNEEIVAIEKDLTPAINETEDKAEKYLAAQQYDSIVIIGKKMEDKIQEVIEKIEAKPAPDKKEGESFKSAVIKSYKFMKNLYAGYKRLGLAKDDVERAGVFKELETIVDGKQVAIDDLQNAQKKFAAANGFQVK
jgi:hypothetical protein